MKIPIFAGVVLVALLTGGGAWADSQCNSPVQDWQPREVLRQQLEQQGWQVQRIKVDDGCYEVRGIDAEGNRFKAQYAPDSLRLQKMKIKNSHRGEQRHGQGPDNL
ncbi:MAG: PepSY domain-containing protein [Burkholderiaceae bacterium]|jgi:hypothetical protein|nr:PepSY domain-containing protein [Burkholderiaceae bacterium]